VAAGGEFLFGRIDQAPGGSGQAQVGAYPACGRGLLVEVQPAGPGAADGELVPARAALGRRLSGPERDHALGAAELTLRPRQSPSIDHMFDDSPAATRDPGLLERTRRRTHLLAGGGRCGTM